LAPGVRSGIDSYVPLLLGSPKENRRAGRGTPVFRFMLNLRLGNMMIGL
jgi:hypothetical protein